MEYRPRYPQPFTLDEAVQLDVPVITEEIARLQNSLEHLRATQEELKQALVNGPDPDFSQALLENDQVIGSQEERISILKLALTEKGLPPSAHFEGPTAATPPGAPSVQTARPIPPSNERAQQSPSRSIQEQIQETYNGGIDL